MQYLDGIVARYHQTKNVKQFITMPRISCFDIINTYAHSTTAAKTNNKFDAWQIALSH